MDDAMLRADCSGCAGLCCVALSFDRSASFAFDKSAGEACRHLTAEHRCRIHTALEAHGMSGCARYDCNGAGQRVTAMFAGRSWRDSPSVMRVMFDAFRILREVHELLVLLRTASALSLAPEQRERLAASAVQLDTSEWTLVDALGFRHSTLAGEVRGLLANLSLRRKPPSDAEGR